MVRNCVEGQSEGLSRVDLPLHKRITKLDAEKASLVEISTKKYYFFPETPQTALEPVRGLENLTPRGHNTNKTKNEF